MSKKSVTSFGEWKSPITSAVAAEKACDFQDLLVDIADNGNGESVLQWLEQCHSPKHSN